MVQFLYTTPDGASESRRRPKITTEPRWFNALGEEVNLDDIDKEYALNILTMYVCNVGYRANDFRTDALVQKLRDVVLNGRERNFRDRCKAIRYNYLCRKQGLPFRAPVR